MQRTEISRQCVPIAAICRTSADCCMPAQIICIGLGLIYVQCPKHTIGNNRKRRSSVLIRAICVIIDNSGKNFHVSRTVIWI